MDAALTNTNRLHPLVTLAAVAITLFSLVGIGAMTGVIPSSRSENAQATAVQESEPAATSEPTTSKATTKAAGSVAAKSATKAHTVTTSNTTHTTAAVPVCSDCGTIESILPVETPGQTNGIGAIAGGVVGGLLGNQIGHGTGRTIATVIGAAGGVYAGNKAEEHFKKTQSWDVTVHMEDDSYRTFSQVTQPSFYAGQKVKIVNGTLVAN